MGVDNVVNECVLDRMGVLITLLFLTLVIQPALHVHGAINEIGAGRPTLASSVAGTGDSSLGVDDSVDTCAQTKKDGQPWWSVDLGDEHVISKVQIKSGQSPLEYMEVWVSDNAEGKGGGVCKYYYNSRIRNETELWCNPIYKARYITIKTRPSRWLTLCDVKVFECEEGYFGLSCSQQCHCINGEICDRVTGECPTSCDIGWSGRSCQNGCQEGTFGPGCFKMCHCRDGDACDVTTGECSSGCQHPWLGPNCQTKIPTLEGSKPVVNGKSSTTMTVEWKSWTGPYDSNVQLHYRILFKMHEFHDSNSEFRQHADVPHKSGVTRQRAVVGNLTVNTHYMYKVVPVLKFPSEEVEGRPSDIGGPDRTECTDPDPPNIEGVDSGVDTSKSPAKAQLQVRWKVREKGVNCDAILWFLVEYKKASDGHWHSEKAAYNMDTKNISGLDFGAKYNVRVVAVNNRELSGYSDTKELLTTSQFLAQPVVDPPHSSDIILIAGIVVGTILILAVVIALLLYRRRQVKYNMIPIKEMSPPPPTPLDTSATNEVKVDIPEGGNSPTDSGVGDGTGSDTTPPSSVDDTLDSIPAAPVVQEEREPPKPTVERIIKVEELEDYVMERRAERSDALKEEYLEIPMGFIAKHDIGKRDGNKHKNRFINIIAYDHSRVILDPIEDEDDSDYINANYIEGYNDPKHYIASQGCTKYTIQDMWRMVWQVSSQRILMVTNLVENGKTKCELYWPEKPNEPKLYREVTVELQDIEETSDFIIRTFNISKDGLTRNVKQFHFIAWPDHGVPSRAGPIIAFRRKVRSYDESHPGPLTVHCSAGVGRTGTYIALDILLDMAKEEGIVDIYGLVWKMRRDRVNMIQTVEQYIFVYDALLEALKAGNTAIPCSSFRQEYNSLCEVDPVKNKSKLQEQFETLQLMSPKVKLEDCKSGCKAENADKNRYPDILPADRHRPYLMTRVDGTNDYINAVYLDGFKKRNAYIISQMPMPHTVIDFWRMVYEHECNSVVMLNMMDAEDETYGQYWLEEESSECGPFIIEPVSLDTSNPDVTVRELRLSYEKSQSPLLPAKKDDKPRLIGQFQLNCWQKGASTPKSAASLIQLIELVERQQQKTGDGPVLIHCDNGVTNSGLYAAVSCIWEKMKVDQEVDIFHAVKHLRYHRPQIVADLEQYQFCFEMVLAYLAEFEIYANFR